MKPANSLIFAQPRVQELIAWLMSIISKFKSEEKSGCDHCKELRNDYLETLNVAQTVSDSAVQALATLLVIVSFGLLVPLLCVVAPLAVWLTLCSLHWVERQKPNRRLGHHTALCVYCSN